MNDQKIIELIRTNKNDEALGALYRFFPIMRKMILSYGGTRQDAEDVFQDALIVFCNKAAQKDFVLTAKLSTYLFSICRYLWKDELKKKQKQVPTDLETELAAESTSYQFDREGEEVARLAEKVLNELGDRCRELLLLFYSAGLKLKDIALKMGYSSEATAKNQKYKCLEAAKNRLRELKQATQIH